MLLKREEKTHRLQTDLLNMVSGLNAKPVARKTHKEDSGYDRRCILGFVVD